MNHSGKENDIELLLEKKFILASQYLSATREMQETLIQKKEKHIIDFISKRQDCINKIKNIDISVQKFIRPGSGKFKEIFHNYLESIKNIFEQIAPIDESITIMVKEESRSIKEELLKINNVRHAAKGYGAKGNKIPRYLDARR
ncbi:hypothetical protein [Desulfobacterium sp. N47]|uniref:Flagellar protein FlgN n=1 Tax=uncultured Desulfobacterium sp. TaxID=201089 RepID=E1YGY3_9BACT|nr:unknown protein [uncultured Desulfobacterium sp.]